MAAVAKNMAAEQRNVENEIRLGRLGDGPETSIALQPLSTRLIL